MPVIGYWENRATEINGIFDKVDAEAESMAEKAGTKSALRFRVALECGTPAAFAR